MAMRSRIPLLVAAVALVLLIGGVVAFLGGRHPVDFGWYAYSPLTDDGSFQGLAGAVAWSRRQLVGAGLVVLGLVLAAGVAGYRWGLGHRPAG